MKWILALTCGLFSAVILGCGSQSVELQNCKSFPIAGEDSICINYAFDLDSIQMDSAVKNWDANTLIVFTGYTLQDKLFYYREDLMNDNIAALMQKYQMVVLNLDDETNGSYAAALEKRVFHLEGMMNYAIVNRNFEVLREMGFTLDQKKIIKFLEGTE